MQNLKHVFFKNGQLCYFKQLLQAERLKHICANISFQIKNNITIMHIITKETLKTK